MPAIRRSGRLALYLFGTFFCCGILFGNYNAMAMEPVGHIAGMAAAISGTLSIHCGHWHRHLDRPAI